MKPKRIVGIGLFYESPSDPKKSARPDRVIEVTKAFADEWDHSMLNRGYLGREAMVAVDRLATLPNGFGCDLSYRGRRFYTLWPSFKSEST